MRLHNLPKIYMLKKKRLGRGIAAGGGKTAGRGTKGQKSRRGYNLPKFFEGGQTSLIKRTPKQRGFYHFKNKPQIIKLSLIEKLFSQNDNISPKLLIERKIISSLPKGGIKILADIKPTKYLIFQDIAISRSIQQNMPDLQVKSLHSSSVKTKHQAVQKKSK